MDSTSPCPDVSTREPKYSPRMGFFDILQSKSIKPYCSEKYPKCREYQVEGRILLQRVSAPVTKVPSQCKEITRVRDTVSLPPRKSASVVYVFVSVVEFRTSRPSAARTLPPRLSVQPTVNPRTSAPVVRQTVATSKGSSNRRDDSLEHMRDRLCRENIRLSAELEKTKNELIRAQLRIKELEAELKQRNRSSFSSYKLSVCWKS